MLVRTIRINRNSETAKSFAWLQGSASLQGGIGCCQKLILLLFNFVCKIKHNVLYLTFFPCNISVAIQDVIFRSVLESIYTIFFTERSKHSLRDELSSTSASVQPCRRLKHWQYEKQWHPWFWNLSGRQPNLLISAPSQSRDELMLV